MKKKFVLFTFYCLLFTAAQAQQVQWTTTTANGDTVRPVKSTQGLLIPFLKFTDGTIQTTLYDSTNLASLYQLSLKVSRTDANILRFTNAENDLWADSMVAKRYIGGSSSLPAALQHASTDWYSEVLGGNSSSTGAGIYLAGNDWPSVSAFGAGDLVLTQGTNGNIRFHNINDVEWMRVTNAGRVGIGTTNPGTKVHIVGSSPQLRLSDTETDATTKNVSIGSTAYTTANNLAGIANMQATSTNNFLTLGGGTSAMNAATIIAFNTALDNNTPTGTERMRITSPGNLGIGRTPSSSSRVEVQASNSQLYTQKWFRSGSAMEIAAIDTNGTSLFKSDGNVPVIMYLDANRLSPNHYVAQYAGRWNGTTIGSINFRAGQDNTNKNAGDFTIETATGGTTVERMRINEFGNTGLGRSPLSAARFAIQASNSQPNIFEGYRSASGISVTALDTTGFGWFSGGLRLGISNTATYAKIDSAKIVADTLKFYIGGAGYKATKE